MAMAGKKTAAVGFIPVLLIAAIFGGYVALVIPNSQTPSNVAGTGSGLQLLVSVNSTSLHVGQSLHITVSLFNSLSETNILQIPTGVPLGNFKVQGFPIALWGGCLYPEPVQFVIVKGNYSLSDLEQLSKNSSSPSVVCMEGGTVNQILFQPNSSVADLSWNFCITECHPNQVNSVRLTSNFTVDGYWVYPLNRSEAQDIYTPYDGCIAPAGNCGVTFNYPEVGPLPQSIFSTGQYTIVVADAWGQVQLLYFTVSS